MNNITNNINKDYDHFVIFQDVFYEGLMSNNKIDRNHGHFVIFQDAYLIIFRDFI